MTTERRRQFRTNFGRVPGAFPDSRSGLIMGDSLGKELWWRNLAHIETVLDGKCHRVRACSIGETDWGSTNHHEGNGLPSLPHQELCRSSYPVCQGLKSYPNFSSIQILHSPRVPYWMES